MHGNGHYTIQCQILTYMLYRPVSKLLLIIGPLFAVDGEGVGCLSLAQSFGVDP